MREKYLVFGTGGASEHFLANTPLDEMALIAGFVDNNPEKQGKEFLGKKIFSIDELEKFSFYKILIASVHFNEIKMQLLNKGIPLEKIDTYLDFFSSNFSQFLHIEKTKDKLKNKDFSLISNSCLGVLLYRKLGLEYKSPFIGTFVPRIHYLKMLQNLEYYLSFEMTAFPHPTNIVGRLDDVMIFFPHEKKHDIAFEKWYKRLERLNFDNLFIHTGFNYISPQYDKICSLDEVKDLPFKNKLLINKQNHYVTNNGLLEIPKISPVDIIDWLNG